MCSTKYYYLFVLYITGHMFCNTKHKACGTKRADPFVRITHVSDYNPTDLSYLCHYAPMSHASDYLPPDGWESDEALGRYLCGSAAIVSLRLADSHTRVPIECTTVHIAPDETVTLIGTDPSGHELSFPIRGYRGVRSQLPPTAMRDQTHRPSTRICRAQCSPYQWDQLKPHRTRLHAALNILPAVPLPAPGAHAAPHALSTGQQSLHTYGSTQPTLGDTTTNPRFQPINLQSEQPWARRQRLPASTLTFDTSTMDPTPLCLPQGSWTAEARHGQAWLLCHPRPFSKHLRSVKPLETDATLDAALLPYLLEKGASLRDIADACHAKREVDNVRYGPHLLAWQKCATMRLGVISGASTLWGCDALTLDPHFKDFISPLPSDVLLGSLPLAESLLALTTMQRSSLKSLILLDNFSALEQTQIVASLPYHDSWVVISSAATRQGPIQTALRSIGRHLDTLIPGQKLLSKDCAWSTGDINWAQLGSSQAVWGGGTDLSASTDHDLWEAVWSPEPIQGCELEDVSEAASDYWKRRQDGAYLEASGNVAACDGSAGGVMGAGAVILEPDGIITTHKVQVLGECSSFRAEAAALHLTLCHADIAVELTIMTDSMNVINALQAWNRVDFMRDMNMQLNADILQKILRQLNRRRAPTKIVKVKSHRGCFLNELADDAAAAAAQDPDSDSIFPALPQGPCITFSWSDEDKWGKPTEESTTDIKKVFKKWKTVTDALNILNARIGQTNAGLFLTRPNLGQHLLAKSRRVRSWTVTEDRRWMQLVARVFPVYSYLRRIDKHPTGDCPWCGTAATSGTPEVRETITHFMSVCPHFAEHRIAAHHAICRATMAAIREAAEPGWVFYYEVPINLLPFDFTWPSPEAAEEGNARRPDGVAWNSASKKLYFLEFTRCMDHEHTMLAALAAKRTQYVKEMAALRCAQRALPRENRLTTIETLPFIFGARGAVRYSEAICSLNALGTPQKKHDTVLAAGVRAAITSCSDMCSARFAELKKLPGKARLPNGRLQRTIIPPKPTQLPTWRSDRGADNGASAR